MFFPPPSAWKMAKDDPKHILENMIGYAHTPHKINEGGYIPILKEVLITPTQYGLTILESGFHH